MKNVILLLSGVLFLLMGQPVQAQMSATLTEEEQAEIQYMLEEEKLARDVYLTMNEKWKRTVFSHIGSSEQRHLNKLKKMAENHNVEIPTSIEKDERGKFQNLDLQKMYGELIASGNTSLENALRAGAKIEEMDIKDLRAAIENTKVESIKEVYQQLAKASENHLQAFVKNLKKEGVTYSPVILSQTDFDAITNVKASCKSNGKKEAGCCSSKKGKNAKAAGCGKGNKGKGKGCCSAKN